MTTWSVGLPCWPAGDVHVGKGKANAHSRPPDLQSGHPGWPASPAAVSFPRVLGGRPWVRPTSRLLLWAPPRGPPSQNLSETPVPATPTPG